MSIDSWIISISVGIVALSFVALVIFLGITLLSVRRTIEDVDDKLHSFDPLFRIVSKTSGAIEKKTCRAIELAEEEEEALIDEEQERKARVLNKALEVAEWTLVGVALWQKLRERK